MVIILVHWLIKKDKEQQFKERWEQMGVEDKPGFYREILTELDKEPANPKFHTFSLGDPFYSTYINIGMWESVEAFDAAVRKSIPEATVVEEDDRLKYSITLENFEFKLRERVVLKIVSDRSAKLP
jgi:hypothetical protein